MFKTIYLAIVVVVLILSGIWHISAPRLTERWISRGHGIRLFGALLLELSIPCVWWGGWYYWVLFAGLTISGVLRLCFPQSSLRSLWPTYPNWVQTCLLVEGAALMWVLHS
jgi:protein-S-isoprenylcysteine O-methyltransferase Ste14